MSLLMFDEKPIYFMPTLCQIAKSDFPAEIAHRGDRYYAQGRVEFTQTDRYAVQAYVRGSEMYSVDVEYATLEPPPEIMVSCTCPYYEGHGICKHIWAVMRKIDEDGVMILKDGTTLLIDATGFDNRIILSIARSGRGKETPSSLSPWRKELRQIDERLRYAGGYESDQPTRKQPDEQEIRFVIDRHANEFNAHLTITPQTRRRLKNGSFGKWGKMDVRNKGPSISEDDYVLATALAGINGATRGNYYGSEGLNAVQARHLLPRLCATEKLYLVEEEDAYGPLTWDDQGAWEVVAEFDRVPDEDAYVLQTLFMRDGEKCPLTEVRGAFNDWMVIKDRICALSSRSQDRAWVRAVISKPGLRVSTDEASAFIHELLTWQNLPRLLLPPDQSFIKMGGPPTLHLALLKPVPPRMRQLPARLMFQYGDTEVPARPALLSYTGSDGRTTLMRDRDVERKAIERLRELGAENPDYFAQEQCHFVFPSDQLMPVVNTLLGEGWKVTAERKQYRPAGAMDVAVKSGVDWFDLEARCDFGEASATLPALLAAVRKKQGWVELDDGTRGVLPEEWLGKWEHMLALGEIEGEQVRFTQAQAGLLDAWLLDQPEINVDETFARVREELRHFSKIQPLPAPEGFRGTLRAYQEEGLGWFEFLQRFGLGGCLADDMGLGKTVQVLALLEGRRARPKKGKGLPSLVVVPRSLIFNWMREAATFTPKLRLLDHTGAKRDLTNGWKNKTDVMLTTYGTLRRDIGLLREVEFDYVILDESQAIKNAVAITSKSARLLRSKHRLAMSGTPVENHLGELWSLMEFLNPGLLGHTSTFDKMWTRNPEPEQRAVLARAMRPFILRRTKSQVAKDLPECQENTLYCELLPRQRKQYDQLREYYRRSLLSKVDKNGLNRSKIQVLEALLRLRQAACHPVLIDPAYEDRDCAKFENLLPRLTELIQEGHKTLIFSQFTSFLALLRERLDEQGIVYEYLDGQTRDRQERVDRFQQTPEIPLFLISLKAGGLGLNLTAADYVFLLDPWWNPAVEAQAIDRAHRIGQVNKVMAYRLIAKDTVEEKVLALQDQKKELADAILNEDNSLIRSITREDLELLLS